MAAQRTLKYYNLDAKTEKLIGALQKANLIDLRKVGDNLFTFDKKDENDAEFNRANGRYNYSYMYPDGKTSRMFVINAANPSAIQILDSHSWYTEKNVYCELTTEIAIGVVSWKSTLIVSIYF